MASIKMCQYINEKPKRPHSLVFSDLLKGLMNWFLPNPVPAMELGLWYHLTLRGLRLVGWYDYITTT